jgi:HK97 family phage prohead protease
VEARAAYPPDAGAAGARTGAVTPAAGLRGQAAEVLEQVRTEGAEVVTADVFDSEAIQVRAAPIVDVDADRGIVEVKIVPYEVEAELDDGLSEVFTRAAFANAIGNPSRCKVTDQQHDRRTAVGKAIALRDEPDGLYGSLQIVDTVAGRDLLTLLRAEILDEMSVEFRPQRKFMRVTRRSADVLVRHDRAVLVGVSPVSAGVYGRDARVLSVRDAERDRELERIRAELLAPPAWQETVARLRDKA